MASSRKPDNVPRALSISDWWFSEHAFKQAESEYRDFVTFFPNRPEVVEAQRRIDSIHRNNRLLSTRLFIR